MLLTLDLGNTSLKGMVWEADAMCFGFRLERGEEPGGQLPSELCRVTEAAGVRGHGVEVPELSWAPGILWVGEELEAPGRVLYERPEELGLDRRVACLGAFGLFGPSLVIDCGTTVTLTHVDRELGLRGIAISAGRACLSSSVARMAPALASFLEPPRERESEPRSLPSGTAGNLSLGLGVGWRGLLRELLLEAEGLLAREGILEGTEICFTGTDAEAARGAVGRGTLAPSLVHRGLHRLLEDRRGS